MYDLKSDCSAKKNCLAKIVFEPEKYLFRLKKQQKRVYFFKLPNPKVMSVLFSQILTHLT